MSLHQVLLLAIQQYATNGPKELPRHLNDRTKDVLKMREANKPRKNAVGPGQPFDSVVSYALGYRLFAKMIKMATKNKTTPKPVSRETGVPGDSTQDGWYLFTHRSGGRREYPNRQDSMRDTTKTCCLPQNDRPDFPSGRSAQRAAPVSIPETESNSSKSSLLLHIPSGPGPVHSLSFLRPLVAHIVGHSLDGRRADLRGEPAPMHAPGCQDHLGPADATTGRHVSSGI